MPGTIECLYFEDVMEEIFDYLSKEDRFNSMLVNKKWYNIITNCPKFANDRHLYLRDCVIHYNRPPASIIMNSSYRFTKMTLSPATLLHFGDSLWAKPFWEYLSESITEITFQHFTENSVYMLKIMPLVTCLNLPFTSFGNMFDLVNKKRHLPCVTNLKELNVKVVELENLPTEAKIKIVFPNLVQIHAEEVKSTGWNGTSLPKILKTYGINSIFIGLDRGIGVRIGTENDFLEHNNIFLNLKSCHVDSLSYNTGSFEYRNYLQQIVDKYPMINSISLLTKTVMPPPLIQITELSLELTAPNVSLNDLAGLTKLQKLEITSSVESSVRCCFSHIPIQQDFLKELQFSIKSFDCLECMQAIVQSYRNLKRFELKVKLQMELGDPFMNFIDNAIENWMNLERLRIILPERYRFLWTSIVSNKNFVRTQMKHFVMSKNFMITSSDIEKLHLLFPNLTYMFIVFDEERDNMLNIVRAILPKFSKVQTLSLSQRKSELYHNFVRHRIQEDPRAALQHIVDYGTSIRVLMLNNCFDSLPVSFQTMENLREVTYHTMISGFHMRQYNTYNHDNFDSVSEKRLFDPT